MNLSIRSNTGRLRKLVFCCAVLISGMAHGAWTELTLDDFESGWGNWVDGGGDAALSTDYAIGTQCLKLQDNSGANSAAWLSSSLDLQAYVTLKIEFTYVTLNFGGSENFLVEFSSDGGSSWVVAGDFVHGVDFSNGVRYYPEVIIDESGYAFSANALIRLRCDASGNADNVFIDDVVISAEAGVSTPPSNPTNLVVTSGDGNALVGWTTNSEPDLAGYNLYRSSVSGSYGVPLATNLTENQYFDTGITNGTPYYYVVTAMDASGNESGFSHEGSGLPMANPVYSVKKGVGNASGNKPLQKERVEALHCSWYYAWSMDRNFEMNSGIEFAPMRHNRWWPDMSELANCGSFSNLLTYNEPDHKKTAGDNKPTVQQALDFWPQFEAASTAYGCRISSPSCSGVYGNDGQWVTNFMSHALAQGLQVDFMGYHKYPNPNGLANSIRNDCDTLWAMYGKPIWITEFNGADWSGSGSWSMVDTYTSMIELLHYFESTPYIERYAVFPWDLTWSAGAPSHIFEVDIAVDQTNTTARLTALGHLYAEYRSVDISGPFEETWYYLHNRGGKERLMNNAGTSAMTDIYTEGKAVQLAVDDAGGGNHFIVNRMSGQRLGYSGTAFFWADSTVSGGSVQWAVSDDVNGWDVIDHPESGKRLNGNPLSMVSAATLNDDVRWSFVRANPLASDLDSDELPDTWEIGQFGTLAASAGGADNYDGDVHTDLEESVSGTDAADSNSFFQVVLTDAAVGILEVSFDGVSNRTYVLETSELLMSNVWTGADTIGPLPADGTQVLQHTGDGSEALFGRVRVSN